ncbi:hypothetical protein QEV68_01670 [Trueperella pyogenes]
MSLAAIEQEPRAFAVVDDAGGGLDVTVGVQEEHFRALARGQVEEVAGSEAVQPRRAVRPAHRDDLHKAEIGESTARDKLLLLREGIPVVGWDAVTLVDDGAGELGRLHAPPPLLVGGRIGRGIHRIVVLT